MKPTLYDIRVDPILSNVSVAYKNALYVAEQICPVIKTKQATGKYYKYGKDKFREVESLRGMGANTIEVGHELSQSDAYTIKEHALKELVPDEMVKESPKPLTPSIDATENITERLLVEKEKALAAYMKSTTNLSNNVTLSGVNQWNDYANSVPLTNIQTGKTAMHAKIFRNPNVLVLGQEVFDQLTEHPDIIDRIKYSQLGVAAETLLAKLFKIDRVIVAGAGYNSAFEGQSDAMAYIWGKYAWLLYVTPRPGIKQVSFAYHFQQDLRVTDKWYDKDRKGTYVRVTDKYVRETISVDCAYLIKNAVN